MKHSRHRHSRHCIPSLYDVLRQPEAAFYSLPDLEIRSGRIFTDGCRRVLDFSPQKITLDVGRTLITFYGRALQIESLNGRRLAVAGQIARIEFAPKWEGDPHAPDL